MSKTVVQILVMIVSLAALMGYVVYNYMIGNSHPLYFAVSMAILSVSLLNMIRGLIRALRYNRNKKDKTSAQKTAEP